MSRSLNFVPMNTHRDDPLQEHHPNGGSKRVRVLYSFPHKLGADRICTTAWQQVNGLSAAGAEVLVCPGALSRPVSSNIRVRPTLARGKIRIPYKILGSMRAFALHDYIVSRRLEKMVGEVDIVHTWPSGALRTLKTAARLGIPAVLERPNAHTRFAYEVVQKECERLGIVLPPNHEHAFKEDVLIKEEAEYEQAYRLLCPSDFVARTFLDRGRAEVFGGVVGDAPEASDGLGGASLRCCPHRAWQSSFRATRRIRYCPELDCRSHRAAPAPIRSGYKPWRTDASRS